MLRIYGLTKSDTIIINQGLTEKSGSAHHIIKLILNFNA